MPSNDTSWHHAPVHRLAEAGACVNTAGTYRKAAPLDKLNVCDDWTRACPRGW